MTTIAQALRMAQSHGLERLDAQLLMLHASGKPASDRAWLLAHDTDELAPVTLAAMSTGVQRRAGGEPLAYITGHKEFFGLDLQVDQRVLVPRADTETLVDWALQVLPRAPQPDAGFAQETTHPPGAAIEVLDLGTGSGAIALALKATRPDLHLRALDASTGALDVARANAQRLQLNVDFQLGCWLDGVAHRYHAIVSNPPYIAAGDQHLGALGHEPLQALVSGIDGLDAIRHIIRQAPAHLQQGGWLLLEHGYDQAASVRDLLLASGFTDVQSRQDLTGIERCSGGRTALLSAEADIFVFSASSPRP